VRAAKDQSPLENAARLVVFRSGARDWLAFRVVLTRLAYKHTSLTDRERCHIGRQTANWAIFPSC